MSYSTFDVALLPSRYEAQIDLLPGQYNLRLVLGDGTDFGRVDTWLSIDSYGGKQLALSSVVLCKRFHSASVPDEETADANLALQYVPLVSKGVQFTPTGDTHFRKGEPLFAYLEVYEPLLASGTTPTVQTQLRVTNTKTGQVKVDTGPRSAADWVQPGKSTIAIAEQIAVDKLPEVKTHEMAVPRIAIVHTWTNTQNEGWFRIEFDRLQIPYSYISDHVIRDTPHLREKYDVILFPPVGGSAQGIVNGTPMRGDPVPWKQSDITPNLGFSPDQTDDMRGGMELRGVLNLQRFIEDGGLFITIANIAQIPIDYGVTTGVSIQDARQLNARGSVFSATFADKKSPIAYGYGDSLPVYFSQAPLLNVQGGPGGFGGGGGGGRGGGGGGGGGGAGGLEPRPSGRGTLTDPDIVQSMPQAGQRPPQRPGEEAAGEGPFGPQAVTPPAMRPRVVLRFNTNEKDLLISGMLAGASELAGKAAVVDVPVGKGHVVMFANNPMWRHQTQGSFFLLFNAAMNYNNLGAGRPEPPARRPEAATGNDQ